MQIGEKQVIRLNDAYTSVSDLDWKPHIHELNHDRVFIERELVAYSNAGNPTYYKFIRNGEYIPSTQRNECECLEIYGDIWAHQNGAILILHDREWIGKTFNPEEVTLYPFYLNIEGVDHGGYGQKLTAIRIRNKFGIERDVLLHDILDIEAILFELSMKDVSWEQFLATEYTRYFIGKINDYLMQALEHVKKYGIIDREESLITINLKAADEENILFTNAWVIELRHKFKLYKSKYLNVQGIEEAYQRWVESEFESKSRLYEILTTQLEK